MKKLLGVLSLIALCIGVFIACGDGATATADSTTDKTVNESPSKSDKKEDGKAVTVAETDGYKIGDKATDFSLKNIDGKMVSLASMKDAKGYIITFTCNHCPYSVMYEDRLIDLHNEMAPKGYPVIAINPNDPDVQPKDSFDAMVERAKEKSFPFAYVFDDGQKVYPKYGATRTPHIFLVDKEMTVRYIGAIDDSARNADAAKLHYVKMAIEAIEAGKDPDPNFTKAIGCTIKKKV